MFVFAVNVLGLYCEKCCYTMECLTREVLVKVIPQYCTAHPVLRIISRNWQKNVVAAFLTGKLAREKNGRFGKAWLGKGGGILWQRRKRQLSESVEIVESAKTSVLSFSNITEYSQSRGNLKRCDGPFLLNEHVDLYFLLHKNIVHIILLNLVKIKKNCRKGKKI